MTLLDVALGAHRAGLCVVPPKEDGSKAPLASWKDYQTRTSSEAEIRGWYSRGRGGIGVICGTTSGHFEVMEFEGRAVAEGLWEDYKAAARSSGLMPVLDRVMRGYGARSPSGGIHLGWRCPDGVSGNTKLAERPATAKELAEDPEEKRKVLIETRGEGGYIVTPPSNGRVHPSGKSYDWLAGGFETITTVSGEERAALLELARSFDQMPRQEFSISKESSEPDDLRPGDDFNTRADWARDILEPAGWSRTGRLGGRERWYRKVGGRPGWTSATITPDGQYLYVFSTSTELPTLVALSRFRAYAYLHHNGDFKAAASELRQQGYGSDAKDEVISADVEATPIPDTQISWPEPLAAEAFHGLAARMVGFIAPYVESDEASTLTQFLTAFGIACGQLPYFQVGATRHAPTTYLGLVGRTSRARKGTSWDPIRTLFRGADPGFSERVMSGLGSGERLVHLVRDPTHDKDGKLTDPGAEDRRLLLQEPELARLLTIVNREGSTLSAYLRAAYDGQALRNEVKTNSAIASSHHIGLIGHCTAEDLAGQLKEQEIRNGLANRILWILARRAQKLADPPIFEGSAVEEAISELGWALSRAQQVRRLRRHAAAQRRWTEWYLGLPDDETGILGAITNRAEAQVIRFSMIYALTDGSELVGVDHLEAAIALWEFSTRCVTHIFGSSTGNLVADRILEALQVEPLLRSEISHQLFGRNLPAQALLEAQRLLERRGLLVRELLPSTGGRRPERWRLK